MSAESSIQARALDLAPGLQTATNMQLSEPSETQAPAQQGSDYSAGSSSRFSAENRLCVGGSDGPYIVAREDERPKDIAADLGIEVGTLLSLNKGVYKGLRADSKLFTGTPVWVPASLRPRGRPRYVEDFDETDDIDADEEEDRDEEDDDEDADDAGKSGSMMMPNGVSLIPVPMDDLPENCSVGCRPLDDAEVERGTVRVSYLMPTRSV